MSNARKQRFNAGQAAVFAIAVVICGACSKQQMQANKPESPATNNESTKPASSIPESPAAAASIQATGFRLDGPAALEMDQIIARIGAREEGRMLAATIAMLSEGHARPQRSARVDSTIGGFSARGTAGSGKAGCRIAAYSDAQIKIEANADGSDAKFVSPLTGTLAKVYGDLPLARASVVIPKGTLLRREENGWTAVVKDPSIEKRLDEISQASAKRGTSVGFSLK